MVIGKKALVAVVLSMAVVAIVAPLLSAAGCDCTDTCGNLFGCFKSGYGECSQVWYHRCYLGHCGGWAPWQADCAYYCEWTNYWCLSGDTCEQVTRYEEVCISS